MEKEVIYMEKRTNWEIEGEKALHKLGLGFESQEEQKSVHFGILGTIWARVMDRSHQNKKLY